MKQQKMTGLDLKSDNGSGSNLASWLPKGRRLHDKTIYSVTYNGVSIDLSTITSIQRSRSGWETRPTIASVTLPDDARLIAAEPDMALQIEALKASNAALLAALVSLEEQFKPVTDTDQYIAGIARAAIAKATPPAN